MKAVAILLVAAGCHSFVLKTITGSLGGALSGYLGYNVYNSLGEAQTILDKTSSDIQLEGNRFDAQFVVNMAQLHQLEDVVRKAETKFDNLEAHLTQRVTELRAAATRHLFEQKMARKNKITLIQVNGSDPKD